MGSEEIEQGCQSTDGLLVDEALQYSSSMERLTADPKIVVAGCGGAGNNSIDRLHRIGVHGAETLAINTDQAHLGRITADKKLLIGKRITKGRGAGGHPEIGEYCAEESRFEIREMLIGADITFVTAGMGGGTGTGSAHIVAEIAKELGSVVIGMVTTPFDVECGRKERAKIGLEKIKAVADSTNVLDNNRLLNIVPDMHMDQAFSVMDQMMSEVIKSISEAIIKPSLINLDFADLKTVMCGGGTSTILYAENSANDPATVVAEALNNPLLDVDYSGAHSTLIHITAGPELTLRQTNELIAGMTEHMDPRANVIFGARTDENFAGDIRIMSIVNGVRIDDPYLGCQIEPKSTFMPMVR